MISALVDTNLLTEIYAVANTPAYLYNRLRTEPGVQRMARETSVANLVAFLEKVSHSRTRSLSDVALAYAALVALSLQETPESRTALESMRTSELDWALPIIERHEATRVGLTRTDVTHTPTTILIPARSGTPNATSNLDLNRSRR